jgi:hypothetical protein
MFLLSFNFIVTIHAFLSGGREAVCERSGYGVVVLQQHLGEGARMGAALLVWCGLLSLGSLSTRGHN